MTDYFALLGQPRRPWLDLEVLKARFHQLCGESHPDHAADQTLGGKQAANQRFTEINAAHTCLSEPRQRLRHLLELELGRKPSDLQELPEHLARLLMEAASLCREADAFIARHSAITSPLLRAQNLEASQGWIDRLMAFQQRLAGQQELLLGDLRAADSIWENTSDRPSLFVTLEKISQGLGFFSRWQQQIQERILRLQFP